MAEIVIQCAGATWAYRKPTRQQIEIDYHDRLGRFGIEAVADDGRIVVLYLSLAEARGMSAALRSEITAVTDRSERPSPVATPRRLSGTMTGGR